MRTVSLLTSTLDPSDFLSTGCLVFLRYCGKKLRNDLPLYEYNIQRESTLFASFDGAFAGVAKRSVEDAEEDTPAAKRWQAAELLGGSQDALTHRMSE